MHVLIAIIYGFTIWFALIGYSVITQSGHTGLILWTGPLTISGSMIALFMLDHALAKVRKLWS